MDGATQVTIARTLQQRAGNAAALRYLARAPSPLKQKVDQARRTNPREFVLKAVREMPAAPQKWTIGEQTAEIVWRMIWMFLPERISRTGVQTDANSRGVEPKWNTRRDAMTLVVGPDFIKDVTNANLDNRITILRLVFLEKDALIEKLKADFGFAAVTDGSSNWTVGELAETYAGLARLSQAERRVLAGVTLRRQANITENGRQFDGEFEWDVSAVAGGSETAPDLTQTLKMADSAFVDPDRASWVVVHEVGHAVDSDKRRRARLAAGVAIAATMRRTDQRRAAVFALYQHDLTGRPLDDVFERDAASFTRALAHATSDNAEAIDARIERLAKGWTLDRIAPLERAILRLALLEMLHPDIVEARAADPARGRDRRGRRARQGVLRRPTLRASSTASSAPLCARCARMARTMAEPDRLESLVERLERDRRASCAPAS